jgi:hypothetical protein
VVLGPMVLRIPGSSLRHVKSLLSSGASRRTEYLLLEHSYAVWLRQIDVWINYKECGYLDTSPRDFGNGTLKRRSA